MTDSQQLMDAFDSRAQRREERRAFFKAAVGAAAVGAGAFALATPAAAQTITDADILNFALNLEYLEAQFYAFAANGTGLAANQITGATGAPGAVTGGRKVNFTDPVVSQYAQEIAADEIAHVNFLRTALGAAAVSMPAINISGDANGAFTAAARAAGVVTADGVFDPYASDEAFLLGAFIFEDVGVTAYKGAAPLITNKTFLDAAAGILAVEAYHAATVRAALYAKGVATPMLRAGADAISAARDSLDGTSDFDQGVSPEVVSSAAAAAYVANGQTISNIVPVPNTTGVAFSRTPGQVLNIVYLTRSQVTMGGFFPAGVNGTIRQSAAN